MKIVVAVLFVLSAVFWSHANIARANHGCKDYETTQLRDKADAVEEAGSNMGGAKILLTSAKLSYGCYLSASSLADKAYYLNGYGGSMLSASMLASIELQLGMACAWDTKTAAVINDSLNSHNYDEQSKYLLKYQVALLQIAHRDSKCPDRWTVFPE